MSGVRKFALEVKWRIENIQAWLLQRDDTLYSPQFLAETLSSTRWKLNLSSNWQLAEKYVSLILQRDIEDGGPKLIDLNYELSFLASDGKPLKSKFCTKFAPKTLSHDLTIKQAEILVEKKEVYLPEGVLTVCCKFWNTLSTVSKEGQCSSLRTVIGTKYMNVNAIINNFHPSSYAVVNFLPPSTDISLISLEVYVSSHDVNSDLRALVFKRKHVECKKLCWYFFKLFVLDSKGVKKELSEIFNLTHSLSSVKHNYIASYDFFRNYLLNRTLSLQLEISYCPGIVSELTENKFNKYENLPYTAAGLENLKARDSEREHSSISDCIPSTDASCIEGGLSGEQNESFDADGKSLPLTSLKEDMLSLYNDRLFCDTKLQTDTETFPAHRNVLGARSPVFKRMFTTDMKETAGECINVPDISSDTVRGMLHFLYTDYVGDLEMQSANDLYIASDKYDIASLKQRCSSFMKKNLSPSNVCDVLVLADMHQDKDLESAAQEYVLTNDEVFHLDEWKLFMKNYSSLAAQVMYLKFTKE
ncbi:unnamed protein product [Larinioides sclopetarius]|uniref:BTB domain-containing protein n=1 Tax=Larinioides sclopetarius TaxID=280406 RepID=A0AAV2BSC3_9ARAC